MAKKRKNKKFPYWLATLIVILVGAASWAFYSIMNQGAGDMLLKFGITNTYYQSLIVVGVVMVLLFLLGFKIKKVLDKVTK